MGDAAVAVLGQERDIDDADLVVFTRGAMAATAAGEGSVLHSVR
jgi:hypothetical protein